MDVRTAEVAAARQQGLITWSQLRAAGLGRATVSRAVAAGRLQRIHRGVYGLAPLPTVPRALVTDAGADPAYVAHVRAVLLSLGDRACAGGRTAAALWGWPMLVEPSRQLDICVDHGRDEVVLPGVRARQRRDVGREQVHPVAGADGLWATSAAATVVDCALERPLLEAVVICDSALRAGSVTPEQLRALAGRLQGVRDARRVRRVLDLADASAGSVLESVLRARLVLAGLTCFETQQVLRDAQGLRILRVDFCFRGQRLVVEVDGRKWHQDASRDCRLDNQLAAAGWRVMRYGWAEVIHDGPAVVAEIAAALRTGTPAVHLARTAAA